MGSMSSWAKNQLKFIALYTKLDPIFGSTKFEPFCENSPWFWLGVWLLVKKQGRVSLV